MPMIFANFILGPPKFTTGVFNQFHKYQIKYYLFPYIFDLGYFYYQGEITKKYFALKMYCKI